MVCDYIFLTILTIGWRGRPSPGVVSFLVCDSLSLSVYIEREITSFDFLVFPHSSLPSLRNRSMNAVQRFMLYTI